MRKNWPILLFLITVLSGFSQNVTIYGFAPTYKGRDITILSYSDYISNTEIPIETQTINDSGTFVFNLSADEIKRVKIRCGKQKTEMYVEPEKKYSVYFPQRDSIQSPNPNIEQNVELTFLGMDTTEINSYIINFNEKFNKFWTENYQSFVVNKARYKLDSFELKMHKQYAYLKSSYFHTFMDYSIADLKFSTFASRDDIAKKYFIGRPIYYNNYEYMSLFNKFFSQYLMNMSLTRDGAEIVSYINGDASYENCMRVFSSDHTLKNDTLRELVLIKSLAEAFYSDKFNKHNIIKLLGYISTSSIIEKHKVIAGNVLHSFSKLQPGAVAPDFTLVDRAGKQVNLSDFKGKYVYVSFWATWCTPCLEEIKLISAFKKKYGNKIVFISIATDDNIETMKTFLTKGKNVKYDWVFLHAGNDKKVTNEYEVLTVPSYFLINKQGNLIQSPALRPSEGIEGVFYNLTKDKNWNPNQIR